MATPHPRTGAVRAQRGGGTRRRARVDGGIGDLQLLVKLQFPRVNRGEALGVPLQTRV